jgi:choline dehydrogenase-like flavoprotein
MNQLLLEDDDRWSRNLSWFGHHMGTTRMSDSPGGGVVDTDCKVFGTANLYVASSSVFPTCGYANPTLTIAALAIRLADHLKMLAKSGLLQEA